MEGIINIHIKRLPEGVYLATSDDIQGLIAQGRTVTETIEIARDVVRKLIEAQNNLTVDRHKVKITSVSKSFDYPIIVSA
mgnify:CR=1 FL=1